MKILLQNIFDEPNAVIALCALAISLISLILSIISGFQNRKNNRLGVRPIAYVLPPDYENRIAVIIQNKGTGPLISKEIRFKDQNNNIKNSLIDFMPVLGAGFHWKTFTKASKIILRPSEEITLLEFQGDKNNEDFRKQRDNIRSVLSQIEISMKYTSIFDESPPFKLNYKLSWFGRIK